MELYEHQKKIIKENKKKVGLFLGTGSAKTATALHLATGSILCITPKIQKEELNFVREAKKWGMEKNITQISKEEFKKFSDTLQRFDTVIVDEAHTVGGVTPNVRYVKKEPVPKTSDLYTRLYNYINKTRPERLYLLTATPVRTPMVVWGLSQLLGYDWNFYEFRDTFYFKVKKGFREFFIPRNDQKAKDKMGRIVRHLGHTGKLDDYFDVPKQTYKDIFVELTKEQKGRLQLLETQFPDPLVLIGKRHQVENGVLNGEQFSEAEMIKDNKIDVIKDLAEEFPKMVIFVKYILQIQKIKEELKKDYNVQVLFGGSKDRDRIISSAESAEKCILIIQSQISAGYQLPSFPVMIFASQSYSVVDRIQSEGRILRADALKKNLYINITARGGIDEAVKKSIENKEDFNEQIYAKKRG